MKTVVSELSPWNISRRWKHLADLLNPALALALLCFLNLSGCGGGSGQPGGGSPPPPSPPSNPVPAITSLTPTHATSSGAGFTLTVNGQNFVSSATVQWNGSRRTPTFVSSSQLQVQISAGDIANAGSSTVSVTNPSPGGGNSGLAMFQVDSTSNPTPSLTGLSPLSIGAGSPAFLLTTYTNF